MTPEQFAYWLQGRAELCKEPPTAKEWEIIKDHLALVFTKVTPPYPQAVWPFQPPPPVDIICGDKTWFADPNGTRYCSNISDYWHGL